MSEPARNEPERNEVQQEPGELMTRAPLSPTSGLRRKSIRLAVALIAVVVAAALIIGLGIDFHGPSQNPPRKIDLPTDNAQPSAIADLPGSYADVSRPKPPSNATPSSPMPEAMHHHGDMAPPSDGAAHNEQLARLLASIQQVGQKNKELADRIASYQSQAAQEQAKVWGSGLFFKIDDVPERRPAEHIADATQPASEAGLLAKANLAAGGTPPQVAATQTPTDQQRKRSFLNESPGPRMDIDRSAVSVHSPAGRSEGYLLQAGAVIPAALLTGINTDLPGDVVASVTEGVYDSPTGNHLLIPQGAKLYGSYDSQIAAAQDRALLVWRRLLLPDGRSINLDRMRGTDASGYAGLADQVDYHADKLASAAVLSGVIAYAGNLAGGRQTLTLTPGDVVGDAIAQQAANTGSSILQRQLNVQPTLTIRPGWPVRALVNRDILLPSYTH